MGHPNMLQCTASPPLPLKADASVEYLISTIYCEMPLDLMFAFVNNSLIIYCVITLCLY